MRNQEELDQQLHLAKVSKTVFATQSLASRSEFRRADYI